MVLLMVISASLSMLVLTVSFGMYGSLNVAISDPIDCLWFLRTHSISNCEVYIVMSVTTLCTSVLLGLYVVYGKVSLAIACTFVSGIFLHYWFFVLKLMSTTHNRLHAKFKVRIAELHTRYNKLQKPEDLDSDAAMDPITSNVVNNN